MEVHSIHIEARRMDAGYSDCIHSNLPVGPASLAISHTQPRLRQFWRSIAAAAGLRRGRWRSRQDYHTLSVHCNWTGQLWVYGLINSLFRDRPGSTGTFPTQMTRALGDAACHSTRAESFFPGGEKGGGIGVESIGR
jgi:hypothetical protein